MQKKFKTKKPLKKIRKYFWAKQIWKKIILNEKASKIKIKKNIFEKNDFLNQK